LSPCWTVPVRRKPHGAGVSDEGARSPGRLGIVLLHEEHFQIGFLDIPYPHVVAHVESLARGSDIFLRPCGT
jgi:hypothetical protein